MANMLIQLKVKDYSNWKNVYDSFEGLRISKGQMSDQVYRDSSDPNKITLVFKWDSLENAKKWSQSTELKAAMEKAGVDGPPSTSFLNES
jgi:heme-degrading monooxygenase HmoA